MSDTLPPNKFGAVIAVASGKGGVGKSTVSVNLACALASLGHKVGLLDADIYGPSQHIMLGLKGQDPVMADEKKFKPIPKHGISVMSFGFFVKPEDAVVWRGPMVSRMFQQLVSDVSWGELDYLVVDLPPGTGDIQLSLAQILSVTGVVIVSTPQDVALADAVKGVSMFRKVNIDILGIIENMSTFVCPHCNHSTDIFSHAGAQNKAKVLEVPFLGEIPLEEQTRKCGDDGIPVVVRDPGAAQSKRFLEIAGKVAAQADEIKKKMPTINIGGPGPEIDKNFSV
ncbi:Mrp/NBP35 family ATP-binding protein [bacterium]|nr:Mrp/NBP35 family ATP-binding protein [bacterium]